MEKARFNHELIANLTAADVEKMSEDDVTLRKKLEVMHKSEIEWQKEQEEQNLTEML